MEPSPAQILVAVGVIGLLVLGTALLPEPAIPVGKAADERGVVLSGEAGRWKDETPVVLRSVMAARSILKEPVFFVGLLGTVTILAIDARRRWPRAVTASALAALALFEVAWEAPDPGLRSGGDVRVRRGVRGIGQARS